MLNHITIMGRLTRDVELRSTQSGTSVASFTVAVDRDFGGRDGGERQTDFIDCVAWRQTGEFVSKYFHKGSMIVVSGRLQSRKWQDRDGNNRTSWEIVADNVYFGESRRDSESNGSYGGYDNSSRSSYESNRGGYGSQPSSAPAPSAFSELDDGDGELPFYATCEAALHKCRFALIALRLVGARARFSRLRVFLRRRSCPKNDLNSFGATVQAYLRFSQMCF